MPIVNSYTQSLIKGLLCILRAGLSLKRLGAAAHKFLFVAQKPQGVSRGDLFVCLFVRGLRKPWKRRLTRTSWSLVSSLDALCTGSDSKALLAHTGRARGIAVPVIAGHCTGEMGGNGPACHWAGGSLRDQSSAVVLQVGGFIIRKLDLSRLSEQSLGAYSSTSRPRFGLLAGSIHETAQL